MKKIFLFILITLLCINPVIAKQKANNNQEDFMVIEDNNYINTSDNIDKTSDDDNINSTSNIDEQNNEDSDAVELDISKNSELKYKECKCNITNSETIDYSSNTDFRISPQNVNQYQNFDIYSKKSKSFAKEKKYKDVTFGTKYDNTFSPNQMEQSRTLFSKYQKDKFSFTTSYKNNSLANFNQQFRGTFSFSPEYEINKHLTLQGIYSKNILDRSNKNEVIFSLKPFKDDRMNFNVGASQIYYEDTTPMRSQFNFATKIKF
mgnify:CR=1 FL=1